MTEKTELFRVTQEDFDLASAEVERLQRELDITNADHIALWLEASMPNAPLGWLACRIVEAHETALRARIQHLRETYLEQIESRIRTYRASGIDECMDEIPELEREAAAIRVLAARAPKPEWRGDPGCP